MYDFLKLFGPVHSWWAFSLEQLISQLQYIPTNHKFGTFLHYVYLLLKHVSRTNVYLGQLEQATYCVFLDAANLQCWLLKPNCPKITCKCKVLFEKLCRKKPVGTAHIQKLSLAENDSSKLH